MDAVHRWLQRAHAGELGAALAYRGHARSVRCPLERARILGILREELAHRAEAAALLVARGHGGDARLARRIARLGRVAGFTCAITGHWAPMMGAALAEAINVGEYRRLAAAARLADDQPALAFARRAELLEGEHAAWFLGCAERHGGVVARVARWLCDRAMAAAGPATPIRAAAAKAAQHPGPWRQVLLPPLRDRTRRGRAQRGTAPAPG